MEVSVNARVVEKRPWLDAGELADLFAHPWAETLREGEHEPAQRMAVAWAWDGTLIEMIAYQCEGADSWQVFHAAKAQKKFLQEMGFSRAQVQEVFGRR